MLKYIYYVCNNNNNNLYSSSKLHSYINSATKKNNYTVGTIMCTKILKNRSVLQENINVMDTDDNYLSRDTD